MEVTALNSAADDKKLRRKQKIIFWFGILGVAALILLLIFIEEFFVDGVKYLLDIFPAFDSYYHSISEFDQRSILNIMFTLSGMGIPAIIGMLIFLTKPAKMYPFRKVGAGIFFAIVFFGFGISMLANLATNIISSYVQNVGYSTEYTEKGMGDTVAEAALRMFTVAVMPAIFEELLFRGAIMQGLRKISCDSFAIFFSAFLFGLVHGNIVQMPFAFLMGIYFAYITVKTKSLFPSITVHFLNNLMSCIMIIMYDMYDTIYVNAVYYLLIMSVTLIGIILIANKAKNKSIYTEPNEKLFPEKNMWLLSLTNIGIIACIAYYGYQAVTLMLR